MSTLPRAPEAHTPAQTQGQGPWALQACLDKGRKQFIELWSQMGSRWGVPRSMVEVHALLFIHGTPLNTDEIMAHLGISRGNASMTLRTLLDWGIVRKEHRKEDRKDYFWAEQDVQTLFCTVMCARKRRELDPLTEALRDCRATTTVPSTTAPSATVATEGEQTAAMDTAVNHPAAPELARAVEQHNRKLDEMLAFMAMLDDITSRFLSAGGCNLPTAYNTLRGECG